MDTPAEQGKCRQGWVFHVVFFRTEEGGIYSSLLFVADVTEDNPLPLSLSLSVEGRDVANYCDTT